MKWLILIIPLIIGLVLINFSIEEKISINEVCIKQECFKVKLAITPEEKRTGLMNQTIKENEGMLFIYNKEDYYNFWMKNTIQPLDIIWIDKDLEIVDFITAYPCSENCPIYTPSARSLYVLEISANKTNELKIIKKEKVMIN